MKRFPYVLMIAIAAIYVAVWLSPPTTRASRPRLARLTGTIPTDAKPDSAPRANITNAARPATSTANAATVANAVAVRQEQEPNYTITEGPKISPAELNRDLRMMAVEPGTRQEDRLFPRPKRIKPQHATEKTSIAPAELAAPVQEGEIVRAAPAPTPLVSFKGLDFSTWGAGWPPDTVGDVGPNHYIQAVNTSIAIYSKTGTQLAAFTYDTLFSGTSTACDNSNQGDPTVIYDPLADRWYVSDFAFTGAGDVPPFYQCIAVSKTGDPVSGGWYLYAIRTDDATHPWFADYPKMGLWPDALFLTANMFDVNTYKEVRVWAFNRGDLLSGAPVRQLIVDLNTATRDGLLPVNMRRGGAPPVGRDQMLVSESQSIFAYEVWKFHVDFNTPANSTFTGPTNVSQTSYSFGTATVTSPANVLDTLEDRMMMQAQYMKVGAAESLWVNHTVRSGGAGTPNGIQWAQINVTGGTVTTTPVQQQIYGNVGADGVHRWMGSIAADVQGNMALGYSASRNTLNPDIRYAGRLLADAVNTLPQTETSLIPAAVVRGTQSGNCAGSPCTRWGDYSAMTLDPDGCTFWYTTEYYETSGTNWQTRIASFKFPGCVALPLTIITWNNPADITQGTPLSATQLNATANSNAPGNPPVPGTFVYSPPAGTVLPAGNNQPLSVTFTPTDPLLGNVASKTVSINVLPVALPNVAISAASVAEPPTGTSQAVFNVSLSAPSAQTVTVNYTTASGGANPATAGSDYTTTNSPALSFAPGETVQTISVPVLADADNGETDETFLLNLTGATNAMIPGGTLSATGTITTANPAGTVLISELRSGGPGGATDEFIELYNNTDSGIDIGGWSLVKSGASCTSTPVVLATIPASTTIPARGHYLVAGQGYTLSTVAGNLILPAAVELEADRNVALFDTATLAAFGTATRRDAVGFAANTGNNCDLLREGVGGGNLPAASASTSQYSFVRKFATGTSQDTNGNSTDFQIVSTTPAVAVGSNATPLLGAPGPENLLSPVQRNAVVKASLVDGTAASTAPPNRVRSGLGGLPGSFGTLSIQRRFKNTTTDPITRLRFRIADITTLNSPVASSPQADLRALTSDGNVTNSAGATVIEVNGVTLEAPAQPNGGGLNSTLTAIPPGGSLAAGASIDVQFLLSVQQNGNFRFLINVEALPAPPAAPILVNKSGSTKSNAVTGAGGMGKPQPK
jgi:hypothetical protein